MKDRRSMSSTAVVLAVLTWVVVWTSTQAQFVDVTGGPKTILSNNVCLFRCRVRPENSQRLPIPPKVTWQRDAAGIGEDPLYLDLSDPFWTQKEKNVVYDAKRRQQCIEVEDESSMFFYNCDFSQELCFLNKHAGDYRCVVRYQNPGDREKSNITVISILDDTGSSAVVREECFFPKPIDFSVKYEEGVSLTVSWRVSDTPANRSICRRSDVFEVRVRWYNSFEDYTSFIHIRGILDFQLVIGTNFTLDFSRHNVDDLNHYIAFDILNVGDLVLSPGSRRQETVSPVYYFGRQEASRIVFPHQQPHVLSEREGRVVELRCEAQGFPPPTVRFYHDTLSFSSDPPPKSVAVKSLIVNQATAGDYYCLASNTIVPPQGGVVSQLATRIITVEIIDEVDLTGPLVCAQHTSPACDEFFQFGDYVLVNQTDISFEATVQNLLDSLYNASFAMDGDREECFDLATEVLCYSAFPLCNRGTLATRPICQRSCDIFRAGGACEGVVTEELFPEVYKMMVSRCGDEEFPAGDSPECVQLRLDQPQASDVSWCSRGDGQMYAGSTYLTENGRLCQDWVAQNPHAHSAFEPSLLHRASRECRNPGGLGERPWCYTVDSQVRWEYCDVEQCSVCEDYNGQFCSQLPGYGQGGSIFVDRHESEWDEAGQKDAEFWMLVTFLNLTSGDLPAGCVQGLRELICHSTLPLCTNATVPAKLCSAHCGLVELLQVCPDSVLEKMQRKMRGRGPTFSQPVCESSASTCLALQASITVPPGARTTDGSNCYNATSNGVDFTGKVTTTLSGATCQAWGANWPDLEDRNYCRNPGPMGLRPWCFTNREEGQWEYCDIPECGAVAESEEVSAVTEFISQDGISSSTVGVIVLFAIVGVFLIVGSLTLAVAIVYVRRRKEFQRRTKNRDLTLFKINQRRDWDYVHNQTYVQVGGLPPKIKEAIDNFPQYDKSSVKYIRQLGSGNFGVVFYARLEGVVEDQKSVEVAVKTLKEEYSTEGLDDFVREAKLMFSFDHPNIVKILGVCVDDLPYYLIFEYMDKGDLAQFLRANASSLQRRQMNPTDGRPRSRTESTFSDEPPALNVDQLADICRQVACGMEYLSDNNHVHRDLACRNCLVRSCDGWEQTESGLIIKIGDFGMSQNLYTSDYYRVRGQAVLPVRWMSPEAVIYGKFSTDSDVWSFGVVMWEVFSFAMQPYYGTSNDEVTENIRRHKLLARPANCPTRMYEVMKNCWTLEPKMRPRFSELVNILTDCRLSISSSESPPIDDCFDGDSELDSDAFYEENSELEEPATPSVGGD